MYANLMRYRNVVIARVEHKGKVDSSKEKRRIFENSTRRDISFLLVYIHIVCLAFNLVFHGLLIVVLDFLVNSCIVRAEFTQEGGTDGERRG